MRREVPAGVHIGADGKAVDDTVLVPEVVDYRGRLADSGVPR
jgi:hypothetical protein